MIASILSSKIDMWLERPVLYKNVSKGYSRRNKPLAVLSKMAEVFGTSSTGKLEQRGTLRTTIKLYTKKLH